MGVAAQAAPRPDVPRGETVRWRPPRWASAELERRRPAAGFLASGGRWRRAWQLLRELPRNVLLYVFRAAPYPTPTGLVVVGHPDRRSPVLVTTNYELTVRRVLRAFRGIDCWLLVAPAGGINVWCAAGGGAFSVDGIVSVLKTSRIGDRVDHRRLVLPQLCANGIDLFALKRRTGWIPSFGPVRIEDVPEYLGRNRKKTPAMRRVTFEPRERFEMALAMWGSLTLRYTVFPLVVLGVKAAACFVGLVAVLALAMAAGCFVLPGRTALQKTGLVGLTILAVALSGKLLAGGLTLGFAGVAATLVTAASFLVGSALPGYSPIWQCAYSRLFYGAPCLRPGVVGAKCSGCGICLEVCPAGCFDRAADHGFEIARPDLCQGCAACIVNCPEQAIVICAGESADRRAACAC